MYLRNAQFKQAAGIASPEAKIMGSDAKIAIKLRSPKKKEEMPCAVVGLA